MTEYKVAIEDSPSAEDLRVVQGGLHSYNMSQVEDARYRKLTIFVRDGAGNVVGGLDGETFWNWLHITILWVEEALRGKGYGTRLIIAAETEALKRDCRYSLLDTHSFQARPFYERLGYEVFGVLEHYPNEHKRIFMQKTLSPERDESDS